MSSKYLHLSTYFCFLFNYLSHLPTREQKTPTKQVQRRLICAMKDSKHYGVKSLTERQEQTVVRKFINPAVYIETSTTNMLSQNSSVDCGHYKVKKCVCTTVREKCPCHPEKTTKTHSVKVSPLSSKSSVQTDSGYSGYTILEKDDLRLSLSSLTANSSINIRNEENRRKVFQEWLAKKKKEEQIKQMLEEKLQMEQELERARKEEEERENFKKWLLNKKNEEVKRKKLEQQQKEEEERIKSAKPKRDPEEKEVALKAWLKQKEQETIVKKIKEKEEELKAAEEKQKRLEESAKAYEEWLKSSKYKPKPIPLNRGIDSLKSSASLTYINPTPWVPNIEQQRNL